MLRRILLRDTETSGWRSFDEPVEVLTARAPADVPLVLTRLRHAVDENGLMAAGFVGYEAAPAFDRSLRSHDDGQLPLAAFGLFKGFRRIDQLPELPVDAGLHDWQLTTGRDAYDRAILGIREQIALGNCYQVNYTVREQARKVDDPWSLFCRIARNARYGAWLEFDNFVVASASPELFFALDDEHITCRPMKGTARRGLTTASDDRIAEALHSSAKNRAENIMITDMIRNDLGRVAVAGTVRALKLCELEKYATVWQMTSTVEARTRAPLEEIFAALFPCASVTGAPKTAAMELIAALEDSPREVYTGAIGWLMPGRQARFSVAIRTAVVDRRRGSAVYGVGGGIVWDSDAAEEYRECLAKARVLRVRDDPAGSFELLETFRWTADEGFFLRGYHLDRLQDSARYFDFPLDRQYVERVLDSGAAAFRAPMRVRLLVSRGGEIRLDAHPLVAAASAPWRLRLARHPVDEQNPFLYHKTSCRRVYDAAIAELDACDDVLLWNSAGYVTETTRANVIVSLRGQQYTPPVSSGLLAGTCRRWLLENTTLEEREITLAELGDAESIAIVNSVRGRVPARLEMSVRAASG
jgi:para-aminobenzoate synthetase / 4-amino-4-deoxychorismate lyase